MQPDCLPIRKIRIFSHRMFFMIFLFSDLISSDICPRPQPLCLRAYANCFRTSFFICIWLTGNQKNKNKDLNSALKLELWTPKWLIVVQLNSWKFLPLIIVRADKKKSLLLQNEFFIQFPRIHCNFHVPKAPEILITEQILKKIIKLQNGLF